MKTEKLTAAYCFVRAWRTVSYAGLLIGCLTSFAWMFYTFGDGITEFYSEFSAKSEAKDKHAAYEEECEQEIENAKKAFEEYTQTLPQRLEAIKQQHPLMLAQHKEETQKYSSIVKSAAASYNEAATIAEEELKKLQNLSASDILPLQLAFRELSSRQDYETLQSDIRTKSDNISRYQSKVQDTVMNAYASYEAPVHAKVDELTKRLQDLTNRISELEKTKKDIPTTRFAARPENNIYGTTDVKSLGSIFDATDILPLMAAQLRSDSPQTENDCCHLRKSLLHMSAWLPAYTRTYVPSQEEINEIREHNRAIDEQIAGLYRELRATESEHSIMARRQSELRQQKDLLSGLTASTTKNWEICTRIATVQRAMEAPFPADPESLDAKLQREKNLIPQKEEELKQLIARTQESIANSEAHLEKQLDLLSAKERKACAAAILQPFPFRTIIGGPADLIENPAGFVTEAVTAALPQQNDLIPHDIVEESIASVLQFASPFGVAGQTFATTMRYIPISYIIYGILLIGSWFSFAILMVAADYLICPLVRTTKIQEIEYNMRRDETK